MEAVELTSKQLDISSRKPLLEVIDEQLLLPHIPLILERGVNTMLDANMTTDLRRMYMLFDRVQAVDKLRLAWSQYIKYVSSLYI
jgi:cullin 4